MENMEECPDPTHYPMKMMTWCGLHPSSKSKFLIVYFCINIFLFGFILILAILGVMDNYENNIFEALECFQTVCLYIHIWGKYPNLYLKRPTLAHLLEQKSKFWKIEDFTGDIYKECHQILSTNSKLIRHFLIVTTIVVLNFFLAPVVTGDLPVRVYVPQGWFHYINLIFWYLLPNILSSIYGSDVIFWSICIPVLVQFKLLAHKLENQKLADDVQTNDQKSQSDFREYLKTVVDHQNFLIEYCKEINRYYSTVMLNQVVLSTAIICMQLFVVSQDEFLLFNKLKCLLYCMMEVFETAIYCVNAELLTEASENVGKAAFKSQWYDSSVDSVKKDINLVIARSQNRILFRGCGLVYVNLKTFTQIFKTALSFFSYLNTMVAYEGN